LLHCFARSSVALQWGATMAQLTNLRGMYESYNFSRKIFGFDTYEEFATVDTKGGGFSKVGDYKTAEHYEGVLEQMLALHESFCPIPHIRKFELVKGDASVTIGTWLEKNPHAIVSLAIFDMDGYKTRDVLEKIKPRLSKGSVLVFDELNCPYFPGETRALDEVIGLNKLSPRRYPQQPYCAWAVYE
jgi:hypothetical protein